MANFTDESVLFANETYSMINRSDRDASIKTTLLLMQYLHIFNRFYMPVVISVGLVGNTLSILVFLTTKLSNVPSSHYLTALAVSDSGMLLCQLFMMSGQHRVPRQGVCQGMIYITNVCSFLSVWYVVSFTIERFIVVCYPLKRLSWCTVHRARTIIISVTVVACFLNLYCWVILRVEPAGYGNRTVCSIPERWLFVGNILNGFDTLLTLVIPMLLIITFNVRIVKHMLLSFQAASFLRRNQDAAASPSDRKAASSSETSAIKHKKGIMAGAKDRHLTPTASPVPSGKLQGSTSSHHSKIAVRDDKITKMLLIISLVFIVMNLPDHVVRMVTFLLSMDWIVLSDSGHLQLRFTHHVVNVLFQTSFAVNFFLYNIVGVNFRRYLKRMCRDALLRCTGHNFFMHSRREHGDTHTTTNHSAHMREDNFQMSNRRANNKDGKSPLRSRNGHLELSEVNEGRLAAGHQATPRLKGKMQEPKSFEALL